MQDQDQEMREEPAEVHEEMQEEMQEGRQEDAAAVSEGLLQARLLHPRLEAHLEALWPTTGRVKKDEVVLES